ncbi:putative peptidase [Polystyrenella longa]|uniref:Putative peptidase n=1 Tax=Polystyrenella longa TaxID=2528007 RepID=A0A518CN11_9PLAN|nr:Xaa-Pro peptidase family protein [Polystyrenella longa]QDU80608.1 putative peptidase [Polystyrenella longa]
MLSKEGCLSRRKRLWNELPADIEWILLADPRSVLYFSNFLVNPLSFSGGERCWLLLERQGKASLLGDNFSIRSASAEPFIDEEIVEKWYDHKHSIGNRDHALVAALKQVAPSLKDRPGVIETEWMPSAILGVMGHGGFSCSEVASSKNESCGSESKESAPARIALGSLVRELRRQKEPDEIELLKLCMKATDAGHARAKEIIKPGISEFEIYREVQNAALAAAGRPGLVYGDFRANNAAMPKAGGLPTDYVLKEQDIFVLDYSVVLHGYRSDFTNAYAVGEPTSDQQKIFNICLECLHAGAEYLKAGVSAKSVYETVTKPMLDAGYPALGHHAGHGIGLGHPESPILVPESTDTLLSGDVVTLEPGMYIEGIGGVRIEHNYLITETGAEQLSNHEISLT